MADVSYMLGDIEVTWLNKRVVKVKKDPAELYEGWMRSDFSAYRDVTTRDGLRIKYPDGRTVIFKSEINDKPR